MNLFNLENVSYKDIVNYENIEIPAGTTFICGESGCGKSTLLKLLNGVISPTCGIIYYKGEDISEIDPIELRREVLLVSQSAYLFDNKTIKENFIEYYSYLNLEQPTEQQINKYLSICCINLPIESDCTVLSGGEKQRVFLAINLSLNPQVLMLDEPTSALDDRTADTLLENIKSYCEKHKISTVIISHDQSIAFKYADRIFTL